MGLKETIAALLGISAYQRVADSQTSLYPQLGDATVDDIREALGGNIQPVIQTKLRWYLADLDSAQASADNGILRPAAQLYRSMRRDGVISGLLGTRAGGLIRLPNNFYGDVGLVEELTRKSGMGERGRSRFDELCPPGELEMMAADVVALNVAVAELVPVQGRDYPVMVRLDPEFLVYRWSENRWYFQSVAGLIPITPGDGRWVLHVSGARISPWISGLWPALGRSFINKEHAMLHRSNYSRTLANPARLAYAPQGATEMQRIGFFKKLLAWGTNTVLELPPGYEAKLLESNGRGIDVFQEEIDTCNNEIMVAIAGQVVTTTGGTGFANADVHKTIREDLIKKDGESLAYTINTQVLPQYVAARYGLRAMQSKNVVIEWDTSTPKELKDQAETLNQIAQALTQLRALLNGSNREIDIDQMGTRFGIPIRKLDDAPAALAALPEQSNANDGGGNDANQSQEGAIAA
jgi:molybdopterin biosynthesis enzyme MoaB